MSVLAGPAPAASAAVGAPKALSVSTVGASTPVLTWERASKATEYEIQVDDDPSFSSPEFGLRTENNNAVPTAHLRPGTAHWRVRAMDGKESSAWVRSSFTVNPADVPAPTHPASGTVLAQPQSPPLLRWTTSRGAISYVVEVDGDADFVGAKQYKTNSTSLVVPDPLGEGDWFWRVIADKGQGITSLPSGTSSFIIQGLALPTLVSPNNTFGEPVEDVVLDWEPVPGAQSYDLQVALEGTFNNFALDVTGVRGTRYSPPTTLNNDDFWWRVRAVDTAGLPTPWAESRYNFTRVWPDLPVAQHPVGSQLSPGNQGMDSTFFQWSPVQHASMYQVEVATSRTFSSLSIIDRCETPATTFAPRFTGRPGDCLIPDTASSVPADQVYWWRVRPLDQPYERTGLPGNFSAPQAFTRTPQPIPTGVAPANWEFTHGTGLKVAMTGNGLTNGAKGCRSTLSVGQPHSSGYSKPSVCPAMSATPVFSWDRMPNMDYYIVWFAQDENFSTTEVQPVVTQNTMLALDTRKDGRDLLQLPDSEANQPYYWYVQPCMDGVDCGLSPYSQYPGVTGAASFQKVSPTITGLSTSSPAGNDISFSWRDYVEESANTWSHGENGTQSAKSYRILVDNEPGFSEPYLDDATVDQATYTSSGTLYPEGTLFWKVLAIDTAGNQIGESAASSLTKSSPPVDLRSPLGGIAVSGTTPLEWNAQAYASQYVVEVYRNGDLSFSAANRVVSVVTRNASYAPTVPIPASSTPYVWRARRIDPAKNPGPWSATGSFVSLGSAPELLGPGSGSMHRGNDLLFSWSDVPGAVSYEVTGSSTKGDGFAEETTASAYAPSRLRDGSWTWRVRALDAAGEILGVSAASPFRVDGTPPTLVSIKGVKLANKTKAKVVAKFSERVRGVSKKTMRLYKKGSKKAIRAKVVVKRTKATLKPKVKLKRGKVYFIKWKPRRIKDAGGNTLVKPKKWMVTVS